MAFRIPNKKPIDISSKRAVGVSLPFSGPAVFNQTYKTADQVKSNLRNYFLTDKGERYMNPFFGSNIRKQVFEQITTGNLDNLKKQIQNDLTVYFPNVSVGDLKVTGTPDLNIVNIVVTYHVVDLNVQDTLSLTL